LQKLVSQYDQKSKSKDSKVATLVL